ncbi:hypothetical protein WR25_05753, partial [Diploscapter pachys]
CQNANITQGTKSYVLPNNACILDDCKPKPYQGGLNCKFNVEVKVGYFATLKVKGKLDSSDIFSTSIADVATLYTSEKLDFHTWLAPTSGAFRLVTGKNTTGNLYVEVEWTKMSHTQYPYKIITSDQEALLMPDAFLYSQPFLVMTAPNKTLSVSVLPYNVPFNQQRLQSFFFFDGPNTTSPFITTGYESWVYSKMIQTTQEYLTIYKVLEVDNDAYILIHPTENVVDISYYDGLWHTNEDVHVTLDATDGKAVFSTYCGNDPEYLTDLTFSDNTATLQVVSTTPSKTYGTNHLALYNSTTAKTALPQEIFAHIKSYILDKGTANFTLLGDASRANYFMPFDGRTGILTSYINNDPTYIQPLAGAHLFAASPGPDPRPMYKFNLAFYGGNITNPNETLSVFVSRSPQDYSAETFTGDLEGRTFSANGYMLAEAHPAPSSAGECELSYQRIPGFYPIIKEAKGKKCKAFLELPMCRGYCKTSESGIHTFPHRRQETVACALVSIKMKNYTLTDCDDGAPASIRYVEIPYGEECMCTSISKIEAQEFGKGGE